VYTCVISGYSKLLAMDGAHVIMEEMVQRDITPTVVSYIALIVGYFKIGDDKKLKFGTGLWFRKALH
jgi:pentatricopeptide repeat protein